MKKTVLLSLIIVFGFITNIHSQVCGGTFTDPAGESANYANGNNYTVTICPTLPGENVTVTFTTFSTEATFDALYVYDGSSTSAPLLPSTNGVGNVPGGLAGGYWGTAIPGPFTSSSPDGCLTFVFRSDGSVNDIGWIANVTCSPAPSCPKPTVLNTTTITHNSARFAWTENGAANMWDIYVAPAGSPAPTSGTNTGIITTSSNGFTYGGLLPNTCYTVYVRAFCSSSDRSEWTTGYNFCTPVAPPVCGGQFTDAGGTSGNYAANSNVTYTICPSNPGDMVTVTFTAFSTEAAYDALYVFDGNTVTAPQISSGNPIGNVPGSMAGGYWGTVIPNPFTASIPSGCLTFNFRSDGSVQTAGWVADVTCAPPPSCSQPLSLVINSTATDSVVLGWANDPTVSSWEVLALPFGIVPTALSIGQTITTNPATLAGLTSSTRYSFYVRANCPAGDHSLWTRVDGFTTIANDSCVNAIEVPVNARTCALTTTGSLIGATASTEALGSTCVGTADDDVWFKFTANDATQHILLQNIQGPTTNLNFAVYSGDCSALTNVYCSAADQVSGLVNNLVVGTTYYLRVYSNASTLQQITFAICITTPSTCETSESICGVNNYANTIDVPSLGTIGCLTTTPNPTYFTVKIASSGDVNLLLTQASIGSPFPNLDVDYAAWGPFNSQAEACAAINSGQEPGIGVPMSLTTGCSYSTSPTENLNIANAQAGQYYALLITNFSNRVGFINVSQSNANTAGAGSIDCSGIRLNAFLDSNANGTQDSGEPNFPLGQFHYEMNSSGNSHAIISPTGTYMLYDYNPANSYNLSYTINSDYAAQYNAPAGFTNISVASGGMTTYDFPVTVIQNYNDIGVTIVSQGSPRAGSSYTVKIIYTNNGTQTIPSGTLTFNNAVGTSITNISQTGTVAITNGFTYAFTNLLPYEIRTIIVTISVPTIPAVTLGQLLTDSVSVTPQSGDLVANNNSNSTTQAVIGSYDPNDKLEGHGEKILFSSFGSNDYLEYTIRFENNGNAGALDITVTDLLDNRLDESSLVMLSSSHSYTLDRLGNNLTWKFNNIQLPVAVPDTEIGKGFVKFKVKPKPGYAIGTIISNTAEIYFDTNPAIVTNTFNTEFVSALGNELFTENSIRLYPNPARNTLYIALQNSTEIINDIAIFDVLGKTVSRVSNVASNQSSIDVSQLSKGIYMVEITTENHLKQVKKLIIQ